MAKRRANNTGTIRKRKNGLWEGIYTVGYSSDGKIQRKSVYGKTQKEVSEKLIAAINDLNQGTFIAADKISVGEWFDEWIVTYNKGVKASTLARYEYEVRRNIKPTLGNVKLQALTTVTVQRLYNDVSERLAPKSVKNLHGVLNKGLNQAVLCQLIKSNPALGVELPRVEKKEMIVITGDDLKAFFQEIKGKAFEDLYFVDVFTGLRESEIIGLTWDCVDFDKGIIRVEKQFKRERKISGNNEYKFDSLKNDKKRIVTPAPVVFDVLKRIRHEQKKNRLKYGDAYNNESGFVFCDELGRHLCHATVWGTFKRRVAAIGKPNARVHDLRHSFATLSLENGTDIKTVSEQLGHASVSFTLDQYGHVTEKMQRESAERMQRMYDSLGA